MNVRLLAVFCLVATPSAAQQIEDVAPLGCPSPDQFCKSSSASLRLAIPKAFKRDYQAQRNVSFCLVDGCDGAIQPNRMLGCAWRLVILASGSSKVDSTDTGFLDAYCASRLSPTEKAAADAQASELFKKVYDRPMRRLPW
ncbi:hypothetical protein [Methylopila sp. M107]|uniref:hypothetical protein n=1 Tax=Methylopila sp. M107 TaxID=1101190 RepID=UPI0004784533|nr:hypothetical protein [Methylopila sp. M107]